MFVSRKATNPDGNKVVELQSNPFYYRTLLNVYFAIITCEELSKKNFNFVLREKTKTAQKHLQHDHQVDIVL